MTTTPPGSLSPRRSPPGRWLRPSGPTWFGLLLAAGVTVVAVAVAGCSQGNEATTPTIELAPTSTPITTEPITAESTTEPDSAEPTADPRIAEIEAAVAASRDVQVEVLTDPSIPVERMEDVATGRALEATVRNTLKARAEGRRFVGDFVRRPLETIVDGTTATHLECGHDRVSVYAADGQLITPPDPTPLLFAYELRREPEGLWKVELVSIGGTEETPCDL